MINYNYLWPVFCYLFSSIPQGYLIPKWVSGKDIRKIDKEKLSGSNVIQNIGILPGVVVGLIDVLKGVIAVYGATRLNLSAEFIAISGISALCGQMWPVFMKFWGGRGGSACIGSLVILSPEILLISILPWILLRILWKKYGSSIGMILLIIISAILGFYFEEKAVLIFSSVALFLVYLQRILGKPGSLWKIKDKKIILWRFLLDRDTKET